MPEVLVIDSYDSFVYNLVQYLGELGATPIVHRNDAITVDEAIALDPDAVLLSPGPGRPESSGIICDAVTAFAEQGTPLLGVCLGHQAIAHAAGAHIVRAPTLMHGKTSPVVHDGSGLFRGLPSPFEATRYHSLVVDAETLAPEWVINGRAPDGTIMGIRHRHRPVHGVQFHPESILTPRGKPLLANFVELAMRPACPTC